MHDTYRVSKYFESLGFLFMLSRDGYHSKASHFQLFVPIGLWGSKCLGALYTLLQACY